MTQNTEQHTVVAISGECGANVVTLDLPTHIVEEEGVEYAAFEHLQSEGAPTDCIMTVEDARNAALYILEHTGGLPPKYFTDGDLVTRGSVGGDCVAECESQETAQLITKALNAFAGEA